MNVHEALTAPGPGGTCRVCNSKLPDGSLRCALCGAVWGEANRCGHCGAVADVEGKGVPGRCRVCGGPRIRVDDAATVRSGRELPVLLRARRARHERVAHLLAALLSLSLALAAVLYPLVSSQAAPLTLGLVLVSVLLGATCFGFFLLLTRRAAVARRLSERSAAEAKLLVASDVLRSHAGALDAPRLARALGVTEHEAELLLAELTLNDFLGMHVDPAGRLRAAAPVPGEVIVTELAEDERSLAPEDRGVRSR